MKKLLLFLPLAAVATLVLMGCPPAKSGNGNGEDSTKVDSIAPQAHDYGAAIITLERTVCYGRCPAYNLKIEGNGKVSYDGRAYVQVMGNQTSQITPEAVKDLVDEFFKIDYYALRDTFTEEITDMPTTISSITVDGKHKQVYDYYGAPQSLKNLEKKIDDVANSARWVTMPAEK